MSSDAQWDARWDQRHLHKPYPDARQLPPTPDESASSLKPTTTTPAYPTPWKKDYYDDQRYDTQRTPGTAGSQPDVQYHHRRHEQRHTPPSSAMTGSSPHGQRLTNPWQGLPLSPRAHQKYISSAPLTLQIPETHGKYIARSIFSSDIRT
jgi:hypothetical protein